MYFHFGHADPQKHAQSQIPLVTLSTHRLSPTWLQLSVTTWTLQEKAAKYDLQIKVDVKLFIFFATSLVN